MNRLRRPGASIWEKLALPNLRRKATNTWSAVEDAYFSTKDTFERHRIVFTVGTSVASVATAWFGYSLRYLHQSKVEERLEAIEHAMKKEIALEHEDLKKMVNAGHITLAGCSAAAGTTLILGYALGWKGGLWYAAKKFKREQLKSINKTGNNQRWTPGLIKTPFLLRRTRAVDASPVSVSKSSEIRPAHSDVKLPIEQQSA